jgi:hypothetical protein
MSEVSPASTSGNMPADRTGNRGIARISRDATGVAEARSLRSTGRAGRSPTARCPAAASSRRTGQGGPYLADNVEMAKALFGVATATGEREGLRTRRPPPTSSQKPSSILRPADIASASPDAQ